MSVAPPRAAALARQEAANDIEERFRTLVQSPLRAGLLRFLSARPHESFELEVLMAAFGRLRMDVDNCLNELVEFGVVAVAPGPPASYSAFRPANEQTARLLDTFLERRAEISTE